MNGNRHYETAEHLLKPAVYRRPTGNKIYVGPPDGAEIPPEPAQVYRALAEAVLAQAQEQRTANLIAYMQGNPSALVSDSLDVTVRERLGLPPDPVMPVADLVAAAPTPDSRCNMPLMDGRNEIRCWLRDGHEGDCK
jgi:hypothetical protein